MPPVDRLTATLLLVCLWTNPSTSLPLLSISPILPESPESPISPISEDAKPSSTMQCSMVLGDVKKFGICPCYTIFDELGIPDASLVEKILAVEDIVCGNTCNGDFANAPPRWNELVACQACQCDSTCVQYNNCCPDVYLMKNVSYTQPAVSECTRLSPTEFDHTDNPVDNQPNIAPYASMITKCPDNGGSMSDKNESRAKCEKPDASKLDEALPVSDTSTNLTFKNVYCARCNKVSDQNMHKWATEVSCENPKNIFNDVIPSKREVYQTLTSEAGVIRTGCQMKYVYSDDNRKSLQRSCRKKKEEVISTCYEEALPFYHNPDFYRMCARYTSHFTTEGKTFKNVFCYLCNKAGLFTRSTLLKVGPSSGLQTNPDTPALSFKAVIDFEHMLEEVAEAAEGDIQDRGSGNNAGDLENDDDDDDDDESANCSPSAFFDNATCSCRDVQCDQWLTFDPETKTCQRLGGTPVGYHACLRVYVDFDQPPTLETIQRLVSEFEDVNPTHRLEIHVPGWCPGDKRIVLHLQSYAADSDVGESGYAFEDTFNADGQIVCQFLTELQNNSSALDNVTTNSRPTMESCSFSMGESNECAQAADSLDRICPSQKGVSHLTTIVVRDVDGQGDAADLQGEAPPDNRDKMAFFPYTRTDHCPFVQIPVVVFDESSADGMLVHRRSARGLEMWKVAFASKNTHVRVCRDDYLPWSWRNTDASLCGGFGILAL